MAVHAWSSFFLLFLPLLLPLMTRRSAHVHPLDRVFFPSAEQTNTAIRSNSMSLKERVSQRLGRFLSIRYDRHHHHHHHRHHHHHHHHHHHSEVPSSPSDATATTSVSTAAPADPLAKQLSFIHDASRYRHYASTPLAFTDGGSGGAESNDMHPTSSSHMSALVPTPLRPPPRPHYYHSRRRSPASTYSHQQYTRSSSKSSTVMSDTTISSHFDSLRGRGEGLDDGDDDDDDLHSIITSMQDDDDDDDDEVENLYPQVAMSVSILPSAMAAATAARSRRYRARAARAAGHHL